MFQPVAVQALSHSSFTVVSASVLRYPSTVDGARSCRYVVDAVLVNVVSFVVVIVVVVVATAAGLSTTRRPPRLRLLSCIDVGGLWRHFDSS